MDARHRLTLSYLQAYPVEAARRLESISPADAASLLSPFEPTDIAGVVEYLLPDVGAALLKHLPSKVAPEVLSHMTSPATIPLLRQCPQDLQVQLLAGLDPSVSPIIRRSLTYPDRTAGSLADPQILTLTPDVAVREALLRVTRDHRRATYYLYVLDRSAKLTGVVSLKTLLAAEADDLVGTVMSTRTVSVSAASTVEELLTHPNWRAFHTMPVVDHTGIFLGALRYRTLRTLEHEFAPPDRPTMLATSLIELWEACALAGLQVMTDLAGAMMPGRGRQPTSRDTHPQS